MKKQFTGYDWLQSYIGVSTLAMLGGLLLAGPNSSILLRIIASVPWYPQIMYVMITSSLMQIILPFTDRPALKWMSNSIDFTIWGAVVLAFFVNRQFGPVIFSCITGMFGNVLVAWNLGKIEKKRLRDLRNRWPK